MIKQGDRGMEKPGKITIPNKSGFSLLELMIVIAIIAIIAIITVPLITLSTNPREKVSSLAEEIAYAMRLTRTSAVARSVTGYVVFDVNNDRFTAFLDLDGNADTSNPRPSSIAEVDAVGITANEEDATLNETIWVNINTKYNAKFRNTPDVAKEPPPDQATTLGTSSPRFSDRTYNMRTYAVFYGNRTASYGRVLVSPDDNQLPTDAGGQWGNKMDDAYTKAVTVSRMSKVRVFTWIETDDKGWVKLY
jgi:prepilin-type N-terminal cleavage/methylation domain-containing protein